MARSEMDLFVQAAFIIKAYMNEEGKPPLLGDNLYQIARCPICLSDMSEDLTSLACGHIFHLSCINQHFKYQGSCPNCQKRASSKEARRLFFPLQKKYVGEYFRTLIQGLDKSSGKQVEALLLEINKITEQNEKNKAKLNANETFIKAKEQQIEHLNEKLNANEQDIRSLVNDNIEYQKANEFLRKNKSEMQDQERSLQEKLAELSKIQTAFDEHKRLKKIMQGHASELIEYKHQLERQRMAPNEMAARFFDLLIMKNLETLKLKQKIKEYPSRLNDKQMETLACQERIESLKRELKEAEEKRSAERKKYQDSKAKYRVLLEKARAKGGDLPEMEDSNTIKPIDLGDIAFTKDLSKPTNFLHSLVTISGRGIKKSTEIIKPKAVFQNRLF